MFKYYVYINDIALHEIYEKHMKYIYRVIYTQFGYTHIHTHIHTYIYIYPRLNKPSVVGSVSL